MKQLRCRDVGFNCDYVMQGQSDDEVMNKAREHGKSAHGINQLSSDQERDVKRQIKNA